MSEPAVDAASQVFAALVLRLADKPLESAFAPAWLLRGCWQRPTGVVSPLRAGTGAHAREGQP